MKIGFDFDEVIIDHHRAKINLALLGGFKLEEWQTNSNIIKQFLPVDFYRGIQKKLYVDETVNSSPVPFAGELLDELSCCDIYLVSARHPDSEAVARAWLLKNLPDKFKQENINFCADENIKIEKINAVRPDYFIDDKIEILDAINPEIKKILFDPDYIGNKLKISSDIQVIHSLKDFLKVIKIG